MGRQFFKNVDYSFTYPLKSVSCSMSYSRGTVSVLEIVFVGQCEVFVCLGFVLTFFFLAAKLIGSRRGRQFFKHVDFSVTYPLNLLVLNGGSHIEVHYYFHQGDTVFAGICLSVCLRTT